MSLPNFNGPAGGRPATVSHTVQCHYPHLGLGAYINACTQAPSHHPNSRPPSLPHQISLNDEEAAANTPAGRRAPPWGLWFLSKPRFFWLRSWPSASARRRLGRRLRRQRRRRRSWLAPSSAWTASPTMSIPEMPSKVHANRLPALHTCTFGLAMLRP